MKDLLKVGCLVEFPNGKILPIICETPRGLLFETENQEVELHDYNFHKCKFLGKPNKMNEREIEIYNKAIDDAIDCLNECCTGVYDDSPIRELKK